MPTTTLILVRHGETEWNAQGRIQGQDNSPLTELGLRQAVAAGHLLKERGIQKLYTSDLGRAKETAEPIAEALGLEAILEPGLRERGFGDLQGLNKEQALSEVGEEAFNRIFLSADEASHQVERLSDLQQRMVATLGTVAKREEGKRVAIVTHGGSIAVVFRHLFNIPFAAPRRFSLLNGSLNSIEIEGDAWKLIGWGECPSLENEIGDDLQ